MHIYDQSSLQGTDASRASSFFIYLLVWGREINFEQRECSQQHIPLNDEAVKARQERKIGQ